MQMVNTVTATSTGPAERLAGAGLWVRTKGFALDFVPIAGYLGVLAGGAWALRRTPAARTFAKIYATPTSAQATNVLLLDVPVMLYFALSEASGWRATIGKRRLGLRVETAEGKRLSVGRALARTALKLLPWELAHTSLYYTPGWPRNARPTPLNYALYGLVYVLGGVYIATLLGSDSGQTLYDKLTRTKVVVAHPDMTKTRND
jgi:uncharacterized RDD family membrane protein YckC